MVIYNVYMQYIFCKNHICVDQLNIYIYMIPETFLSYNLSIESFEFPHMQLLHQQVMTILFLILNICMMSFCCFIPLFMTFSIIIFERRAIALLVSVQNSEGKLSTINYICSRLFININRLLMIFYFQLLLPRSFK